jgi:hypothetical protein
MAGLTVGFGRALLVVVGLSFLLRWGHPDVAVGLLDAGVASLIGCSRYFKNPPIRRMKNPRWSRTRAGSGCCDWRILWSYRSWITMG